MRRYRQLLLDLEEDEYGEAPAAPSTTPEPEEGSAEDPYLKKALEVLKGEAQKAARLETPPPAELELAPAA